IPTIGIGAGAGCDGQVLVIHDLLGLGNGDHLPKFVRQYATLADDAVEAVQAWFADIDSGSFPSDDETYHMAAESAEILKEMSAHRASHPSQADDIMADEAMEN
ncbi:MAG: 3-methyl-2-oxobutanoate hydroxymethyltransferase, partial [Acidimicrobiia bacterium]